MAEYYSILKRTIGSLPENNGSARRAVYSRARTAIVNQLKAYDPPLSPSEITAEQLRLEEAIRKVEAEAARESLGLQAAPPVTPAAPAQPAPPVSAPTTAPAPEQGAPASEAPAPAQTEAAPSPLKSTLAEAAPLGTAATQAVQNAKDAFQPVTDFDGGETAARQEPVLETGTAAYGQDDAGQASTAAYPEPPLDSGVDAPEPEEMAPRSRRARGGRRSASEALRQGGRRSMASIGLVAVLVLLAIGALAVVVSQIGTIASFFTGSDDQPQVAAVAPAEDPAPAPAQPEAAPEAENGPEKISDRLLGDNGEPLAATDARTVTTTLITPEGTSQAPQTPPAAPATVGAEPPAGDVTALVPEVPAANVPVLTDGDQDNGSEQVAAWSTPAVEPAAPPAPAISATPQRSILYEEGEASSGAGSASQGEVVWGVAEERDLIGNSQSVLKAVIKIPERQVTVNLTIKPNDDASLPASHLVELRYEFPDGFSSGDVVNVPGLVMKPTEEARGDALLGASVKVSEGYFWIALSSLPNERDRNLALLRDRGWIDIPMLFDNGKRGILTLEKGQDGTSAIEQAVAAWQAG